MHSTKQSVGIIASGFCPRYHFLTYLSMIQKNTEQLYKICVTTLYLVSFLLCFKGVLVNMDHIEFLGGGALELAGGARVPIAQNRRAAARSAYLAYCSRRFQAGGGRLA